MVNGCCCCGVATNDSCGLNNAGFISCEFPSINGCCSAIRLLGIVAKMCGYKK